MEQTHRSHEESLSIRCFYSSYRETQPVRHFYSSHRDSQWSRRHSSYRESQPVRRLYSSCRENRSKCKHLLVEISVQRVQLTDIMLNSKDSHHSWLSCMKCVVCSGTKLFSLRHNTCIQLQLNNEYHNSAFSVYQFINNKYSVFNPAN